MLHVVGPSDDDPADRTKKDRASEYDQTEAELDAAPIATQEMRTLAKRERSPISMVLPPPRAADDDEQTPAPQWIPADTLLPKPIHPRRRLWIAVGVLAAGTAVASTAAVMYFRNESQPIVSASEMPPEPSVAPEPPAPPAPSPVTESVPAPPPAPVEMSASTEPKPKVTRKAPPKPAPTTLTLKKIKPKKVATATKVKKPTAAKKPTSAKKRR